MGKKEGGEKCWWNRGKKKGEERNRSRECEKAKRVLERERKNELTIFAHSCYKCGCVILKVLCTSLIYINRG